MKALRLGELKLYVRSFIRSWNVKKLKPLVDAETEEEEERNEVS
jgi:hypothetical protein